MAYDFSTYANQATSAYNQAMLYKPSEASRDTAASRVRSRLQGAQGGIESQLADTFAGRGVAGSGMYRGELNKSRGNYIGSLATGLADNEKNYQDSLGTWANTMANIGQGFGQLGQQSVQAQNLFDQIQLGNKNASITEADNNARNAISAESNKIQSRQVDNTAKNNTQTSLIDLLKTFGQYGNTSYGGWGSPSLYNKYSSLVQQLQGGM